ncbi:hydrogenase formation protein HypD [Leptolyngbya cf. ectocarpi LEGE 11479]|uniref:Hydrogenase formation protein HypD n=1 Tax=Leptolyngbya cf. ectocarpi LEGE 11479 TaxID=1828722 RepID=A0A928X2L4_LEPEC|nr:hydrogenase formation protein HypD [Leptolyngbya ectocarpi]MBE9066636.1 hydrogenase formation protein HypD [Leptolyngbya cf. ectocarpi LEGE 11479]
MKYVDEYRNGSVVQEYVDAIASLTTQPWTLMEICGGQTHTIVKYGLDQLLPPDITLIHGPGCPVCVTDMAIIDHALALAAQPEIIFCSYGDMLRVPGTSTDLLSVKAQGGDVRMVYSPVNALALARKHPDRQVVFFAVGFETTAPATAMAVYQAHQQQIDNFSVLIAHVLVPPAMEAILSSSDCQVQSFLAAGHVCTITGYEGYHEMAERYHTPIVVTGFEPVDILQGVYLCLKQLEAGRAQVENQYARSVQVQGNLPAQQLMSEVFQVVPRVWRGLGSLAQSGLGLREPYAYLDAQLRFADRFSTSPLPHSPSFSENACISGLILQGLKKPHECPAFGNKCCPEHPLGAPMVSSEGACAAYYRYRSTL